MQAPNGDVIEAIQRVAARPEGQLIRKYLEQCQHDTSARLAQERDPVTLRILQGQAQAIGVLLKDWKP